MGFTPGFRLNELEAECAIYKDKAAAVEQQRQVVLNQTQEKMLAQVRDCVTLCKHDWMIL